MLYLSSIAISVFLCMLSPSTLFSAVGHSIDHPISLSSRRVAASRAIETKRSDALFQDTFAEHFAGAEIMDWMKNLTRDGTVRSGKIPVRTRYFDDFCLDCVAKGFKQYVCLGCGMDSRCFRLPFQRSARFYEVDCAPILQYKARVVEAKGFTPICCRHTVEADFCSDEEWVRKLEYWNPSEISAWLLEGLVM
jgi:methyltransferase (TIGR00027 family)